MIVINNLTKSTPEKLLFADLSFTLRHGDRLGIIGQNGCGKSTLLSILAGTIAPDNGTVQIAGEVVCVMPQQLEVTRDVTLNDYLALTDRPEAWRLLSELGLIDLPIDTPVAALSGGQKTKLLLIRTFTASSTLLLLDEPTNHLDAATRAWLMGQLRAYQGTVVLISHDRSFLNRCTSHILEIDSANHRATVYTGNYDAYLAQKAQWVEKQEAAHKLQQRKKRDMEHWLALKRQEAAVYPSPAKGRQIRQMERRLEREVLSQQIARPRDTKAIGRAEFAGAIHAGKLMLRCTALRCMAGDRQIITDATLEIRGRTHVRLVGQNGAGKSTLLRTLVGEVPAVDGSVEVGAGVRIGYFAQQLETLDVGRSVLATVLHHPQLRMSEARARAVLGAFLFTGDAIFKKVGQLSYGERVRLQLLLLLQKECELLVLDEPTNHLDIASREVVEDALRAYEGALIVVSHDEYFLDAIGIDTTYIVEDGVVRQTKR